EPEEGVAFPGELELARGMFRAAAVDHLAVLLELLASHAVEPLVLALEQVFRVASTDLLDQRGLRPGMLRLGGAHAVVVTATESPPRGLEALRDGRGPLGRVDTRGLGRLEHLLAVLVHAHHEMERPAG